MELEDIVLNGKMSLKQSVEAGMRIRKLRVTNRQAAASVSALQDLPEIYAISNGPSKQDRSQIDRQSLLFQSENRIAQLDDEITSKFQSLNLKLQ